MPAECRDQLGGYKTAPRHAQVETAEHAGHQQGFLALGGVFRQQRGGIRHARAQAQAGQEAQHQQLFDVTAIGRRQAEGTEHQHRTDQYDFTSEAIRQGTGAQGAEDHADQGGTHHRPQAGAIDAPVLGQGRRDKAHGRRVQAIEKDNQETQDHHSPLIARQRLGIDKGLHIEAVTDSRLRLAHYGYSTQETQADAGRQMPAIEKNGRYRAQWAGRQWPGRRVR
ncbi:hypothetical protein D3C78_554120 [compost metagenome]